MTFNVAVVGATGNVGREILNILIEREFPVDQITALASSVSRGKEISYGDDVIKVQELEGFDFSKTDIALFSAGSEVSAKYAPEAAKYAVVIDNTSFFRMFDDVPLTVPEVNIDSVAGYKKRKIISNPNCAAIQIAVAINPLQKLSKIKRLVVTTMQSVSGAGKDAMDELYDQTKGSYMNAEMRMKSFTKRIAFNLIPQIGDIGNDGYCEEEQKISEELKKIVSKDIESSITTVRVPLFIGHSISVNVEMEKEHNLKDIYKILDNAPGVYLVD
ncbi:UNVERIFIED_CONTAM: hypothetical protein GTU68_045263, partial [Idotea baltica]|nr:hypothetical protein [Idotea baltica]